MKLAEFIQSRARQKSHQGQPIPVRFLVASVGVLLGPEEPYQFIDRERFAFLNVAVVQTAAAERVVPQLVLGLRRGEFEQAADPFDVLVDRPGRHRRRVERDDFTQCLASVRWYLVHVRGQFFQRFNVGQYLVFANVADRNVAHNLYT